jgi:hypothetical protein
VSVRSVQGYHFGSDRLLWSLNGHQLWRSALKSA